MNMEGCLEQEIMIFENKDLESCRLSSCNEVYACQGEPSFCLYKNEEKEIFVRK